MKVLSVILILMVGMTNLAVAGNNDKDDKPAEAAVEANSSIAGTIVDNETGETLTGVEVKLKGTDMKTYTDFDGKFVFDHVNPGQYAVEANIISYRNVETPSISVDANEMHAFNLELKTLDQK